MSLTLEEKARAVAESAGMPASSVSHEIMRDSDVGYWFGALRNLLAAGLIDGLCLDIRDVRSNKLSGSAAPPRCCWQFCSEDRGMVAPIVEALYEQLQWGAKTTAAHAAKDNGSGI